MALNTEVILFFLMVALLNGLLFDDKYKRLAKIGAYAFLYAVLLLWGLGKGTVTSVALLKYSVIISFIVFLVLSLFLFFYYLRAYIKSF